VVDHRLLVQLAPLRDQPEALQLLGSPLAPEQQQVPLVELQLE
jgi:hypothetical protein